MPPGGPAGELTGPDLDPGPRSRGADRVGDLTEAVLDPAADVVDGVVERLGVVQGEEPADYVFHIGELHQVVGTGIEKERLARDRGVDHLRQRLGVGLVRAVDPGDPADNDV